MEKMIFETIKSEVVSQQIPGEYLTLKENKDNFSVYYFSTLICKIKITKNNKFLVFDKKHIDLFESEYKITTIKSDLDHIRVHFFSIDDIQNIAKYVVQIINSVSVSSTFDVCSRYMQCSDEKRCVHPDKIHAKECSYRQKLEQGIIFYGKNRNI